MEEEGDTIDLKSAPIAPLTSPHMSSSVTPKGLMNSLEQESSGKSIGGSTTEDGAKKFHSLAEIYVDTLEEELDPDELVEITVEELITCREAATETMWHKAIQNELEAIEKNKT